jgi:hypothetical protein
MQQTRQVLDREELVFDDGLEAGCSWVPQQGSDHYLARGVVDGTIELGGLLGVERRNIGILYYRMNDDQNGVFASRSAARDRIII